METWPPKALRQGGSLLAMSGQTHLPAVIDAMREGSSDLGYWWTFAYRTPGGQAPRIWPRRVNTFWKPVLWMAKGDPGNDTVSDVVSSDVNDNDKRFHAWGQSESGMTDLMKRIIKPGSFVVDPMCGAGTTGLAALALDCSFLGIEIDQETATVATGPSGPAMSGEERTGWRDEEYRRRNGPARARTTMTALTDGSATFRRPWEPVSLAGLTSGTSGPLEPTLLSRADGQALIYATKLNLLAGPTESGKSWLSLYAVAQVLESGCLAGLIDHEDTPDTAVQRLRALGVSAETIDRRFLYFDAPGPMKDLDEAIWTERVKRRGVPALLVVDSSNESLAAHGLDPNTATDVIAFHKRMVWLADLGTGVLMIDHLAKLRGPGDRFPAGSERKLSGISGCALEVRVNRDQQFGRGRTGKATVVLTKDRLGHLRGLQGDRKALAIFEMVSDPNGSITAELRAPDSRGAEGRGGSDVGTPFLPTAVMERVCNVLAETETPLSQRAIRDRVSGKHQTILTALRELIKGGRVETTRGPKGAILHTLVRTGEVEPQ